MTEELVVKMIANVGVPTAICFYTLFKVNKSVENLTDAFNRWSDIFDQRIKDLEQDVRALQRKE